MRLAFSVFLGLWVLYTFSGCAEMLQSLRDESAAVDREADPEGAEEEELAYKPKNLRGLSAKNVPSYEPEVARGYGRRLASYGDEFGDNVPTVPSVPPEYRRYTKSDFVDRVANENSLWDGQGQDNFLFSQNRQREPGDLITVDVEKELKREIQYQLWMTLPPEQRRLKRVPASTETAKTGANGAAPAAGADAAKTEKAAEEKNRDAAEEAAKTNLASSGKEDDVVRMEVAENLGNGLVRMVGQKRVIYRGQTRIVEIMSLVNNKDVDDSGRVKSSAFLDMKTQVIQ